MKKIFILFTILTITALLYAQTPVSKLWHVYNDGTMTGLDNATSLVTDSMGNIFVTGISIETTERGQFTTIKYDTSGNELWQVDFTGPSTNKINRGNKIIKDDEGNIYAVGVISEKGGDIGILKYNSDSLIWAKAYTPSWFGDYSDEGLDIGVDEDGNIYAIGRATSTSGSFDDVYTFRIDSDGNIIWEHQFSENSATDYPSSIAVNNDGDVYALSSSFNFWGSGNFDITTIHYDAAGVEQWISRYNGEGNDMDLSTDIINDETDNQFICGATVNTNGDQDFVVFKQNEFGTRLWTDIYGGSAGENDTAFAINYLTDGKVIVTGKSYETIAGESIETATTILINADGSIAFTDNYSGDGNYGASGLAIAVDSMNGIYVAGYVNTVDGQKDGLLIKYDTLGEKEWVEIFDGEEHLADQFNDIQLDIELDIIVTGHSFNLPTNARYLTVKYDQEMVEDTTGNGGIDTNQVAINSDLFESLLIYPNPAGNYVFIATESILSDASILYLIDINGKQIEMPFNYDQEKLILDLHNYSAGIYFIKIQDGNKLYQGKINKLE